MASKKGKDPEPYIQMLQDSCNVLSMCWTEFELDLINLIRDKHPIIYKTIDDDMDRYQKSAMVRKAWKEIGEKFKELPLEYIKNRWKNIMNHYVYIKIYDELEDPINRKFADGTLYFLNSELYNLKPIKLRTKSKEQEHTIPEDSSSSVSVPYDASIRQLIHEEIDIDDGIDIKIEEDNDLNCDINEDESLNKTVDEMNLPDHYVTETIESNEEERELEKEWDEEELLNATRLTQEMIQELIRIKTKQYYTAPIRKEE